jgi:hypothetical protein
VPVGRQSGLASIGAGSQHHLLDLAWRAFLRNHALDVAAMDLFVAPTIGFDLLYVLVIVRLERRKLVCVNVTPHPDLGVDCTPDHRGIPLS